MIINLLCKSLIAILDILLLDFYLKNIYPDVYKREFKKIKFIIYFIIFFLILVFVKNIITYICVHLITIILLYLKYAYFHVNKIDYIKKITVFYLLSSMIHIFVLFFLAWIFNTQPLYFYPNHSLPYLIICHVMTYYIVYFILLLHLKKSFINYGAFKFLSLCTFIFFCIAVAFENPVLFFTKSIARTYIFTVVISIVALICFDRMQTKYEADKHKKEAIIQNMVKEEEFIQQLDKQQSKIREINHNLNHILTILQSDLQQGKYKEAQEYIEKNLDIHIKEYQALVHTGMTMIDSTINHQIYRMKEQNIEYKEDITKILHLGCIGPEDLSLILGLALDNAREACEKVEHQRQISLRLQSKQTHLIIHITNSIPKGSHPHFHKTSKKDSIAHGYGVKVIKEIAEKYHGDVKYEVQEDCVVLRIVLQK